MSGDDRQEWPGRLYMTGGLTGPFDIGSMASAAPQGMLDPGPGTMSSVVPANGVVAQHDCSMSGFGCHGDELGDLLDSMARGDPIIGPLGVAQGLGVDPAAAPQTLDPGGALGVLKGTAFPPQVEESALAAHHSPFSVEHLEDTRVAMTAANSTLPNTVETADGVGARWPPQVVPSLNTTGPAPGLFDSPLTPAPGTVSAVPAEAGSDLEKDINELMEVILQNELDLIQGAQLLEHPPAVRTGVVSGAGPAPDPVVVPRMLSSAFQRSRASWASSQPSVGRTASQVQVGTALQTVEGHAEASGLRRHRDSITSTQALGGEKQRAAEAEFQSAALPSLQPAKGNTLFRGADGRPSFHAARGSLRHHQARSGGLPGQTSLLEANRALAPYSDRSHADRVVNYASIVGANRTRFPGSHSQAGSLPVVPSSSGLLSGGNVPMAARVVPTQPLSLPSNSNQLQQANSTRRNEQAAIASPRQRLLQLPGPCTTLDGHSAGASEHLTQGMVDSTTRPKVLSRSYKDRMTADTDGYDVEQGALEQEWAKRTRTMTSAAGTVLAAPASWPQGLQGLQEEASLQGHRVASERQRRQRIRDGMRLLRDAVGASGDNASVLHQAVIHIHTLQGELEDIREQHSSSTKR